MRKLHIALFPIILVTFAIGTNLHSKSQSHLGTEGFLCPDRGWITALPGAATPTYTVKWCYSGSGCLEENDFVYVSVQTREAYIQCRPETSKILSFAFGLATGIAGVMTAGGWVQMAMQAIRTGIRTGVKIGKDQIKGSGGGDGCYCFAERWTSVEAIYATVISDDERTISVQVPPDFLSQVNSENVNQYGLLNIVDNSCNSIWTSALCQYTHIRTKKTMSWSDLADELAWLGDHGTRPGNLYIWNQATVPAVQCNSLPRKEGVVEKRQWCFNNARSNCDDDIITFSYRGSAEIKCRPATSIEIPPIGSMIMRAYDLKVDKNSNCICYPANLDSRPAKVRVKDESGDYVNLDILTDQFWGLGWDQIDSGVKAKFTSASSGNWYKNIMRNYEGAQVKYRYDWDEFGDDFAWWGDRNADPDGLYKLPTYICAQPMFSNFDVSRDLTTGNCLYSDGDAIRQTDRTQLNMQADGHLCIYQRNSVNESWQYRWGSLTAGQGRGPYRACMQRDGNFVLYDSNNAPLWYTRTNGFYECSILKVQTDGNVVLYQPRNGIITPVWYSNTVM